MGWADQLRNVARNLAGTTGSALVDYSEGESFPFMKADKEDEDPRGKSKAGLDDQDDSPGGDHPDTAISNPVPDDASGDDPKSLFWDPFAIIEQLGYKERPSAVTYGTLKTMVWRTPIVQAVILNRIQQIASFCQPAKSRYDIGFKIQTRESVKQPSKIELKWIQQAENLMMRTGVTDNPRGRDTLEKLVRKLMWDSLTFDQMCLEIVPNKKGIPVEWYAVDASTIRLADTASVYLNEDKKDAVRYVQIYDGMIISEYTQEEMVFGIRNPRTDIRLFGYGVSELEMLMSVVTAILYGWEYNQKAFSQGSTQKGVLNFKGAIPERQLKAFRRHWYQMISGIENSFRTPITNAEDLQWINMQNTNRDMEYSAWFDFLIKLVCAVYSTDPIEINFKYGNAGQKSALQDQGNKEKITESKERGLRPLLRFLETIFNQNIIWPINENFEFKWVGLDANTKTEMADLNTKLVKSTRTIDELRAEDDLPPLPDGKGKCILDSTWMQFSSAKDAAKQQQQQGGMPGQPGMPGQQGPGQEGQQAPGQPGGQEGQPGGEQGQEEKVDFNKLLGQQADEEDQANDEEEGEEEETAKSMAAHRNNKLRVNLRL